MLYTYYPNLNQPEHTNYSAILQISTQNQHCIRTYINPYNQTQKQHSIINSTNNIHIFDIDSTAYIIELVS